MSNTAAPLILGVDDDEKNLKLLKRIVESGGYRFLPATSGAEALQLLKQHTPRILLLDIMMPGMNGFEVALRLRTEHRDLAVPIIFVTARQGQEDVRGGLAAGGNDFVVKPYDREKLLNRIEVWIAKAHTVKTRV